MKSSNFSALTDLVLVDVEILFPIRKIYGITFSIWTCPMRPAKNSSSRIPDSNARNGGKRNNNLKAKNIYSN